MWRIIMVDCRCAFLFLLSASWSWQPRAKRASQCQKGSAVVLFALVWGGVSLLCFPRGQLSFMMLHLQSHELWRVTLVAATARLRFFCVFVIGCCDDSLKNGEASGTLELVYGCSRWQRSYIMLLSPHSRMSIGESLWCLRRLANERRSFTDQGARVWLLPSTRSRMSFGESFWLL